MPAGPSSSKAATSAQDLTPVAEYARLLASVGINGCNVNNVNAAPRLLDADHLKQLARIADTMRPWGVRLALSVALASPQKIGGLATYDPLDPAVKAWWTAKAKRFTRSFPTSPASLSRPTPRASPAPPATDAPRPTPPTCWPRRSQPHGGMVLYRAFVYNHHLDWRDPKADRARAAYDIFRPLDGRSPPMS